MKHLTGELLSGGNCLLVMTVMVDRGSDRDGDRMVVTVMVVTVMVVTVIGSWNGYGERNRFTVAMQYAISRRLLLHITVLTLLLNCESRANPCPFCDSALGENSLVSTTSLEETSFILSIKCLELLLEVCLTCILSKL
jgi:hypothetical protein